MALITNKYVNTILQPQGKRREALPTEPAEPCLNSKVTEF